MPLKYQICI